MQLSMKHIITIVLLSLTILHAKDLDHHSADNKASIEKNMQSAQKHIFNEFNSKLNTQEKYFLKSKIFANENTIPLIYFDQVTELFEACKQANSSASNNDICKEILLTMPQDQTMPENKGFNLKIKSLRQKIIKNFSVTFKADTVFNDPELLDKLRFVQLLKNAHLNVTLPRVVDNTQLLNTITVLQKKLKPITMDFRYSFFNKIVYDLSNHINLSQYRKVIPLVNTIWGNPDLMHMISESSYGIVKANIKAHERPPERILNVFNHKLKNLLLDAVWEVDQKQGTFPLSAYIFNNSYLLSQSDSTEISNRIIDFGKANEHLAYRIDILDSTTWKNDSYIHLDSLAEIEIKLIHTIISNNTYTYLRKEAEAEVSVILDGSTFVDLLSKRNMTLTLTSILDKNRKNLSKLSVWLPFISKNKHTQLQSMSNKNWKKAINKYLTKNTQVYNYMALLLKEVMYIDYTGTATDLRYLVAI